jgi:cell division protein ZapA
MNAVQAAVTKTTSRTGSYNKEECPLYLRNNALRVLVGKEVRMMNPTKPVNTTKVVICGEDLVLRGQESVEYMQSLAREVDLRMERLRSMYPTMVRHRLAMLTAIYLADELTKLQQEYDRLLSVSKEAR